MSKTHFKAGDLVQLKAGGPKMVIESVFSSDSYECTWFAGAKHNSKYFTGDALQPWADDE